MLKLDFTNEMVFGFQGPNLSMLGKPEDFKLPGKFILSLTDCNAPTTIEINAQDFIEMDDNECKVIFSSEKSAKSWGVMKSDKLILFELDYRIWERIFQFCALLSWDLQTYYLNHYEGGLLDMNLEQDCHIIWSSEF